MGSVPSRCMQTHTHPGGSTCSSSHTWWWTHLVPYSWRTFLAWLGRTSSSPRWTPPRISCARGHAHQPQLACGCLGWLGSLTIRAYAGRTSRSPCHLTGYWKWESIHHPASRFLATHLDASFVPSSFRRSFECHLPEDLTWGTQSPFCGRGEQLARTQPEEECQSQLSFSGSFARSQCSDHRCGWSVSCCSCICCRSLGNPLYQRKASSGTWDLQDQSLLASELEFSVVASFHIQFLQSWRLQIWIQEY